MGLVWFTTTKLDFRIQVSGNDNQWNNNHNRLLSLNNVGTSQMIGGISNYVEPKFHLTVFFLKFLFWSYEMDTMFADDVGFKIGLSCELIFVESFSLDNMGLNSFLSHKTNTMFNVASVFVGSYLYETDCVIDYDSTIT